MTIMEAIGGHNGETITEILGGRNGETIANTIEKKGGADHDPQTWTIILDANGGSYENNETKLRVSVAKGSSANTLQAPSQSPLGKTFSGWAKAKTAKEATVETPFTPDKDVTLYAVWAVAEAEPPAEEPGE